MINLNTPDRNAATDPTEERKGKILIDVNVPTEKAAIGSTIFRKPTTVNTVVTAGYVQKHHFLDPNENYELIKGAVK